MPSLIITRRRLISAAFCILLAAHTSLLAESPVADLEAIERAFVDLAGRVGPSVVAIETTRDSREAGEPVTQHTSPMIGSGVVLDANGLILTNEHVVRSGGRILVTLHTGRRYEARIVAADARSDLAVIGIDARGLTSANMGNLSDVRVGQFAFAMGNPFGSSSDGQSSLSYGIVSALGRSLRELEEDDRKYYGNLIQTTADINPGNSGGPLFDIKGQVIGITTALETRSNSHDNLGYAIPICDRTRKVIETLSRGQEVSYGGLGVQIADEFSGRANSAESAAKGVLVTKVLASSPALKAGVREGDRIVRYGQEPVQSADHLIRLVGETPVGETVPVLISRAAQEMLLHATIAPRDIVLVGGHPQLNR
jgi:S1-C subfamily serine protease